MPFWPNRFGLSTIRSGLGVVSVLAGATARWDASQIAGANNDLIATFADVVGSNDATASGSARATLKTANQNGLNILRFDGVANAFTLTTPISGDGPWTWAVVVKTNSGGMPLFGAISSYFAGCYRGDANGGHVGDKSQYQFVSAGSSMPAPSAWEVVIVSHTGAALGGAYMVDGTGYALENINYGPGNCGGDVEAFGRYRAVYIRGGDIGEIAYWPSVLSDDDKLAVTTELSTKWGI